MYQGNGEERGPGSARLPPPNHHQGSARTRLKDPPGNINQEAGCCDIYIIDKAINQSGQSGNGDGSDARGRGTA